MLLLKHANLIPLEGLCMCRSLSLDALSYSQKACDLTSCLCTNVRKGFLMMLPYLNLLCSLLVSFITYFTTLYYLSIYFMLISPLTWYNLHYCKNIICPIQYYWVDCAKHSASSDYSNIFQI